MVDVTFESVSKRFGQVEVIPELDLTLKSCEFTVLLGPSGCGKTTLLRMVAGLEYPSTGTIRIGEKEVTDLKPSARDIAMVFQSYALYPHLSVADNLAFPLRVQRVSKAERAHRSAGVAEVLGLTELMDRKPRQLSGGQRQRVALGRAMVREPGVFLFDEPLSNLDASMREEMRSELIRFHKHHGKTMIYVTHDQVEAMTMAQRIVVMKDGIIQQIGTAREVYQNPTNTFVARFIGSPGMNLLNFTADEKLHAGGSPITCLAGYNPPDRDAVTIGFRPEDVAFEPIEGPAIRFSVRVIELQPLGASVLVDLETIGSRPLRLIAQTAWREPMPVPEQEVTVFIPADRIRYFDAANAKCGQSKVNLPLPHRGGPLPCPGSTGY